MLQRSTSPDKEYTQDEGMKMQTINSKQDLMSHDMTFKELFQQMEDKLYQYEKASNEIQALQEKKMTVANVCVF